MDGGACWAAVHGVAKNWTQLSDFAFTFHFHALEKEMATHSSVLAWRIPGAAEPGGLLSMGSHRVGHDWSDLAAAGSPRGFPGSSVGKESACNAGDSGSIPGLGRFSRGGHGNPLQYSCLENPGDGGAWWAVIYGFAQSRTWLKWLSSSNSSSSSIQYIYKYRRRERSAFSFNHIAGCSCTSLFS